MCSPAGKSASPSASPTTSTPRSLPPRTSSGSHQPASAPKLRSTPHATCTPAPRSGWNTRPWATCKPSCSKPASRSTNSAPNSPATTTPTTAPRPTGTRSSRVRPAQSPDSTASSPASTARSRNVDPIITCPAALTEPQNARVPEPDEIELTGGGRTTVHRRGQVVVRDTGPWTPAVHTLLRHLERVGFAAAPRLVGSGIDPDGRETLTYIDGEFTQPGPWSLDGAAAVGQLLRDLHQATATYQPAPDAIWFPWHGRKLGGSARVIG